MSKVRFNNLAPHYVYLLDFIISYLLILQFDWLRSSHMTINVRVYSQVLTNVGRMKSVLPSDFKKTGNTLFISPGFIANNKTNIDCICWEYAKLLPEERIAYFRQYICSQQMQSIFVYYYSSTKNAGL